MHPSILFYKNKKTSDVAKAMSDTAGRHVLRSFSEGGTGKQLSDHCFQWFFRL